MTEFSDLFALEIAMRAASHIERMPGLATLRWSLPTLESVSDVGAFVRFGDHWRESAKLVTADWVVDGSDGWLDFLVWLAPGERPLMEIINYRERWDAVPLMIVATNVRVEDCKS